MKLARTLLLGPIPILMKGVEQKWINTYLRYNSELLQKEMLGYAGENNSMWTNNASYFSRETREDSVFGKQLLNLKNVCWMNPYTVVEHVPTDWAELNVAIYHVYKSNFSMRNTFKVKVAPMSRIEEETIPWTEIWTTPWPLPGHHDQARD